jgi:hypothetical protein
MDTEELLEGVRASLHRLLEAAKAQGKQIARVQWSDVYQDAWATDLTREEGLELIRAELNHNPQWWLQEIVSSPNSGSI